MTDGRAIVAFRCDHPWEDHCHPRYCGEGRPYLQMTYPGPEYPFPTRSERGKGMRDERPKIATGVQVHARIPLEGDPVPAAARRLAALGAGEIRYARAVIADVGRLRCSDCEASVPVNLDGTLRAHGPKDRRCTGIGTGDGEPVIVHSVLVSGDGHWAAYWRNGLRVGSWWRREPCAGTTLTKVLSRTL